MRPIKKIHLQETITSLSLINSGSLLLVGTEGGNLKTSSLIDILEGSSTDSVDYLFTHLGQVCQITDQIIKLGISDLIVAASDTGLHYGFFDTVMQTLSFEGCEAQLKGKNVLSVKHLPFNNTEEATSFVLKIKDGDQIILTKLTV